jgi:D-arginine dehydrogenase
VTSTAQFLIIGGGIAGLSTAARLAAHGPTTVLEAETALGYHSSGRSATFFHFGIGNATVRALTAYSRAFLEAPPEDFTATPLCRPTPALFIAKPGMLAAMADLKRAMDRVTDTIAVVNAPEIAALCPVLRCGADDVVAGLVDTSGRRLDPDALLQGYARQVRTRGGTVVTGCRIAAITRAGGVWIVQTDKGDQYAAPVLVNAAGAWADVVGEMAGVRPLGLAPKRRTIIVFDAPAGVDARNWPFVKSVVDDFYMLPEAGRLMASPVDEVPSEPTDAQPEDYDIALAAHKVEEWTTMPVERVVHRWAGLRSFVADRVPTAGFAADAEGFFWLAGQGGYGLQTAPAMAEITEAAITGGAFPAGLAALGVAPSQIGPARLFRD